MWRYFAVASRCEAALISRLPAATLPPEAISKAVAAETDCV